MRGSLYITVSLPTMLSCECTWNFQWLKTRALCADNVTNDKVANIQHTTECKTGKKYHSMWLQIWDKMSLKYFKVQHSEVNRIMSSILLSVSVAYRHLCNIYLEVMHYIYKINTNCLILCHKYLSLSLHSLSILSGVWMTVMTFHTERINGFANRGFSASKYFEERKIIHLIHSTPKLLP